MFPELTACLDTLAAIRDEHEVDNLDAIILAALADMTVSRRDGVLIGRPVSAYTLVDRVGLPRETVRRRLVALVRRGLVEHVRPNYLLGAGILMRRAAA